MADFKHMPADGGGIHKGEPDGVSGTPGVGKPGQVHGHLGGGDSAGGAYPNPHSGEESEDGGPVEDVGPTDLGGQFENAYYGGSNPNATASGGIFSGQQPAPRVTETPVRETHEMTAGKQTFEVVEDSGVAAAEATDKAGDGRAL